MEEIFVNFVDKKWRIFVRNEADISVMREIFKLREYRKAEDAIKNAKNPILDIGAHAGFFSIYTRALNPRVYIYAVEPAKNNVELLKKHIITNKLKKIKVCSEALGNHTGKGYLKITPDEHNYFLTAIKEKDTETVDVSTFKNFCQKNKFKKISLVKMDIEGGELTVLQNMDAEDFSLVEAFVLEYHFGDKTKNTLEQILRENKFSVQIFPSRFDKTMGFIYAKNKNNN